MEDLADLFTFPVGVCGNVLFFDPPCPLHKLAVGTLTEIIARRHAEAIARQIGCAENNHDSAEKAGAGHTGNNSECRDNAIGCTVNEIPKVAVRKARTKPVLNRGRRVHSLYLRGGRVLLVRVFVPRLTHILRVVKMQVLVQQVEIEGI